MTAWQTTFFSAFRSHTDTKGVRVMPSNRDGFDDEYEQLLLLDSQAMSNKDEFYSALLGSNASKNRYPTVLPNEATRVRLQPLTSRGDGDYINANYIDGRKLFGVPFTYIATQAPTRATVGDFWRMVHEHKVEFVVMLTAEVENGRVKAERYWPSIIHEVMPVGNLNVTLLTENFRMESVYRTLSVSCMGEERLVQLYCFTGWPDGSVPYNTTGLMDIIYSLGRQQNSTKSPIVVHCSGGVGRTGVFIVLHVALALFQMETPFDIFHITKKLRICRSGMVQRKDQYVFCYFAMVREMQRMLWAHFHPQDAIAEANQRNAVILSLHAQQDSDTSNIVPETHHHRHLRTSAHRVLFPQYLDDSSSHPNPDPDPKPNTAVFHAPRAVESYHHRPSPARDVYYSPSKQYAPSLVDKVYSMRSMNQTLRLTPQRAVPDLDNIMPVGTTHATSPIGMAAVPSQEIEPSPHSRNHSPGSVTGGVLGAQYGSPSHEILSKPISFSAQPLAFTPPQLAPQKLTPPPKRGAGGIGGLASALESTLFGN